MFTLLKNQQLKQVKASSCTGTLPPYFFKAFHLRDKFLNSYKNDFQINSN